MLLKQDEIKELESYLGFPIKRVEITLESRNPHDETFSYGLCQRFYNKNDELKIAINKTTSILLSLVKLSNEKNNKQISTYFSLLGNMYYILGDFNKSIGCFMKALSYNKNDLTNWIELIFTLRVGGNFEVFEDLIFNLKKIYNAWKIDSEKRLNKEKVYELINKVKN